MLVLRCRADLGMIIGDRGFHAGQDLALVVRKSETYCVGRGFLLKRTPSSFVAANTTMLDDQRKRIVLIDDHALVRQGLERLLNLGGEFVVCEEAGDAGEGMEMVREMRPDAVVVDVQLPGVDGIELTRELIRAFPHLIVIALSASEEPEVALRAMHAGAMAYVAKSEGIEGLLIALRNAFNRKRSFPILEKFGGIV